MYKPDNGMVFIIELSYFHLASVIYVFADYLSPCCTVLACSQSCTFRLTLWGPFKCYVTQWRWGYGSADISVSIVDVPALRGGGWVSNL